MKQIILFLITIILLSFSYSYDDGVMPCAPKRAVCCISSTDIYSCKCVTTNPFNCQVFYGICLDESKRRIFWKTASGFVTSKCSN